MTTKKKTDEETVDATDEVNSAVGALVASALDAETTAKAAGLADTAIKILDGLTSTPLFCIYVDSMQAKSEEHMKEKARDFLKSLDEKQLAGAKEAYGEDVVKEIMEWTPPPTTTSKVTRSILSGGLSLGASLLAGRPIMIRAPKAPVNGAAATT